MAVRRKPKQRLRKVKKTLLAINPECHWCGCKVGENEKNEATLDHLVPRSKGGSDSELNLVLSCKKCNHDKGNRMDFSHKEARKNKNKR